jgi:2-keto-4-pentenoate hydratase/2-oxohepta-3-ene-1,7-dioic acid hydratase in catechol pathway
MRLVRVDYRGVPTCGALLDDLESVRLLAADPFDRLATTSTITTVHRSSVLVPAMPSKVIAVGRNFVAHINEMGLGAGQQPSVFLKPPQTLVPHGANVVLPPPAMSSQVEHEAELAIVIGRAGRNIPAACAFSYVLGITCADDVSARDLQRGDPQLTRGKGFDTFCPIGMFVETDVDENTRYEITCHVNGRERQRATTADMLFPIPDLIEWISAWTTLVPGDLIRTGSPAGTGPLAPGDQVDISVTGVAHLQHGVEASPSLS